MGLIRIDHNPEKRQLAVFGAAWLVFFACVGGGIYARHGATAVVLAIWLAAVIVPLIGLFRPGFLRIAYLGMSYAAFPIGFIVSYAILAILYYLVITPIGLTARLAGYDPMNRMFDRDRRSYWTAREPAQGVEQYFHQF